MWWINKRIFWRYEPNFKNPKLIVYFIDKHKLYELTPPYYFYLKLIEKESVEELKAFLKYSKEDQLKEISELENNLLQLGVIYNE